MPLIIAVLVIIALVVILRDKEKDTDLQRANLEKDIRKTNALLERKTLDRFMKQGMSFHDAYQATRDEIVKLGFVPCIPSSAYPKETYLSVSLEKTAPIETSFVKDPEQYDSEAVKTRRDLLKRQKLPTEWVYKDFPTSKYEYERDLKRAALFAQQIEKGECFTYPGYGTCEVVGYNYGIDGILQATSGYYIARVVATGETIDCIKIGDNKIRRV